MGMGSLMQKTWNCLSTEINNFVPGPASTWQAHSLVLLGSNRGQSHSPWLLEHISLNGKCSYTEELCK